MAQFLGAHAGIRDAEYADLRSKTSEKPFSYLTRFEPAGVCPKKELPYTCHWGEGGRHMTTDSLRVGVGLTKERGNIKPSMQLVGPGRFQLGNGDLDYVQDNTSLRNGTRQVLRGSTRPSTELKGCSAFQQGQAPWTSFCFTSDRSRNKYEFAIQSTSSYITAFAPPQCLHVEPFRPAGISTRVAKDFAC
jgi:hypothetical protein